MGRTGRVSVALLPPHMCDFLRRSVHVRVCSQPRCFNGKRLFFSPFLFLAPSALIFIRKPVCGLPLSITPLYSLSSRVFTVPAGLSVFLPLRTGLLTEPPQVEGDVELKPA